MKTITMYELLGLVKDGKAPRKIKYNNSIYVFNDNKVWADEVYSIANNSNVHLNFKHIKSLNDEVEILEEEKQDNFTGFKIYEDGMVISSIDWTDEEKKIPETLEDGARFQYSQIPSWFRGKELIDTINENFEKHQKAIYELIDCLKHLKGKGDE